MQALHDKYSKQGLAVVGFPCNQFNKQEPGTAKDIRTFCTDSYSVTFDMFAKIEVNGDSATPFYKHLTGLDAKPKGAGKVTWNFEKFVIDRRGNVVGRFGPRTKPDDPAIIKLIESGLAEK